MGFSFSKQELFIKITIFLVLFTWALHCSTFTKKSCRWPAGLQVFIFGHQSKHSSRQKLYIFILVKLQDSLIQCCAKAKCWPTKQYWEHINCSLRRVLKFVPLVWKSFECQAQKLYEN